MVAVLGLEAGVGVALGLEVQVVAAFAELHIVV